MFQKRKLRPKVTTLPGPQPCVKSTHSQRVCRIHSLSFLMTFTGTERTVVSTTAGKPTRKNHGIRPDFTVTAKSVLSKGSGGQAPMKRRTEQPTLAGLFPSRALWSISSLPFPNRHFGDGLCSHLEHCVCFCHPAVRARRSPRLQ